MSKYVAVHNLAARSRARALIRAAMRCTNPGSDSSLTSAKGASGTKATPAFRYDSGSSCQNRTTR